MQENEKEMIECQDPEDIMAVPARDRAAARMADLEWDQAEALACLEWGRAEARVCREWDRAEARVCREWDRAEARVCREYPWEDPPGRPDLQDRTAPDGDRGLTEEAAVWAAWAPFFWGQAD